jgi:hypothetical protein
MSPKDIKVGETYINRFTGLTRRTVLAIGPEHCPYNIGREEPGVLYSQGGKEYKIHLCYFAQWAGKEEKE